MNYIKKSVIRGMLFGIPMGAFINQLIYVIIAIGNTTFLISSHTIIFEFFISILVGFYCAGISVIFEVEEWSMLHQTVTHSIAMLPYLPVAAYAGWRPDILVGRIMLIIIYIFIYVIIWFSFKKYWERKVRELNEQLDKM